MMAILALLPAPWGTIAAVATASVAALLFLRAYHLTQADRDAFQRRLLRHQLRADQRNRLQIGAAYRINSDGVLLDANPAFRSLLDGRTPQHVADCFERPELWAEICAGVAVQDCVDREVNIRLGGAPLQTLQRFWALRDGSGRITEIEASVLDVTALRAQAAQARQLGNELAQARRELEQKNQQIQACNDTIAQLRQRSARDRRDNLEFLGAFGRQTRRQIASLLQLAGATSGNSAAETIASAREVLAWLDDIGELADLETTRPIAVREPFSLRQVLDQSIGKVALEAEKKHTDLTIVLGPQTPDLVLGDSPQLERILAALLENAVACSDHGVIGLRVTGQPDAEAEQRVRFSIKMTGAGLPRVALEPGGNPLAGKTERVESEVALRLAIARELVRRLNGELDIHNEPGVGATIQFSLPLVVRHNDAAAHPDLSALLDVPVLIVDPHAGSRDALFETLQGWKMRVATARDTDSALYALREAAAGQNPFRILIADAGPPTGGLQLAEFVLDDPTFQIVRPILLLPPSQRRWQNEPLLPGLRATLAKPLRERELAAALLGCIRDEGRPEKGPVSRRILIAEDDAVNRRIALRLVQRMGYEADGVANGQEALDALQARPYGVVFMDCVMPVMDGFRATALIRQLPNPTRNIPIVALTANALAGDRRRCLDAGMSDYISKPFTYEDLRASIERWIDAGCPAPSIASAEL